MVFIAISAHFFGLFSGGFLVKDILAASKMMMRTSFVCLCGSLVFLVDIQVLLLFILGLISFSAGLFVASWGYYMKSGTKSGERIKTAADVLIYSNILMIMINVASVLLSAYTGLALSAAALIGVLYFTTKLKTEQHQSKPVVARAEATGAFKPLGFLCLFVAVITINSGLMYEVINPAFAQHETLVSFYWAVPYIIALYIMRNLPREANRTYALLVGIAMIGLAFVFFMLLDRSAMSYLVIDTLMLGACGVFDLFWWSILGEMLDLSTNPAKIFGIGLSANVLGVLIGGMVGNAIYSVDPHNYNPTIIALIVVFIVLIILPLLNSSLSRILSDHAYLSKISGMTEVEQSKEIVSLVKRYELTGREGEIVMLLLKGRTYKMIAEELYLSENTVKTHLKNAYAKLEVNNKSDLVKIFADKT